MMYCVTHIASTANDFALLTSVLVHINCASDLLRPYQIGRLDIKHSNMHVMVDIDISLGFDGF